jgi:membrane fusion protein (multidrug efflux system)
VSGAVNRRLRPLLLIAVPSIAVLAALLFWLWTGRYVTTENAYVKAHIAQISAEVAGRIQEVHVHDHADVKVGDVLFTLDQEPFRVALSKAVAELDSIRSQVRTLNMTVDEAKSELQEAESKVATGTQLARQKTLADRGIVSSSKLEEVENNTVAAVDRVSWCAEGGARCHPIDRRSGAPRGRAPDGAREAGRARARLELSAP